MRLLPARQQDGAVRGWDSHEQGASLLTLRGERGRENILVLQKGLMKARRISTRPQAAPCECRGCTFRSSSLLKDSEPVSGYLFPEFW